MRLRRRLCWIAVIGLLPLVMSACTPQVPTAHGPAGCVSHQEAARIWTDVDNRLNALELAPTRPGADSAATGNALVMIQQYLQQQLVAQHFTEREVDRLDQLTIVSAGCSGGTLVVRVTMKLLRDDYIAADGHVDHVDVSVGQTLHLLQSYVRSGTTWKESDFQSLDQPPPGSSPTPSPPQLL